MDTILRRICQNISVYQTLKVMPQKEVRPNTTVAYRPFTALTYYILWLSSTHSAKCAVLIHYATVVNLPAVLITGHAGEGAQDARREGGGTGPFAMLRKPASVDAVEAQIAALARPAA